MTKTKHFDFLLSIRKNLLTYLDNLTPEQLGYIPTGFSNNIFWNIAHCIAVQQFLCYQLSGNKLLISTDFFREIQSWYLSSKDCTFKGRNLPSKGIVTQYSQSITRRLSRKVIQ